MGLLGELCMKLWWSWLTRQKCGCRPERLQAPSRASPRERTLVLQVPELYGVELLKTLGVPDDGTTSSGYWIHSFRGWRFLDGFQPWFGLAFPCYYQISPFGDGKISSDSQCVLEIHKLCFDFTAWSMPMAHKETSDWRLLTGVETVNRTGVLGVGLNVCFTLWWPLAFWGQQ